MQNLRLVCGNCGDIQYFEDFEDAFQQGWDTVERFGYNCCSGCPGVSVYFPMYYASEARRFEVGSAEWQELIDKAMASTLEHDPSHREGTALEQALARMTPEQKEQMEEIKKTLSEKE